MLKASQGTCDGAIRAFGHEDMDVVLDIWLHASVQAHDFIDPGFWQARVEDMRTLYLPASEVYVYQSAGKVLGFYALNGDWLAAVFVAPARQGQGIGRRLLEHARQRREHVLLTVYKANEQACRFYLAHGFQVLSEQLDEHTGHPEWVLQG